MEPFINQTGIGKRFLPERGFWEMIHKNFPPHSKFHFIQVGANDGISFDILYDIVKGRNSKGIVIEPLKDIYKKLCKNYQNFPAIIKVEKAVHPFQKKVKLYRVDPKREHELQNWVVGIASLDPNHHKKSNTSQEFIIEQEVEADTLMGIVNNAGTGYDVDLLQTDVEGFDFEILKMINFQLLKPSVIKYEWCNLSEQDRVSSKKLLSGNGYYSYAIGDDMIAILLNKIKL